MSHDLGHVLFIGGSACAGKTSVARLLAAEHDLDLYSWDEHFAAHGRRADARRHRAFRHLADRSPEELWRPPVAARVEELRAFYADELELVLEDLHRRPGGPVLVEGVGLLPELLDDLPGLDGRALWLVATPKHRRKIAEERRPRFEPMLARCPDPRIAWDVWMRRDDRLAERIEFEARRRGRPVLRIDGRRSVEATARLAARRLALAEIS